MEGEVTFGEAEKKAIEIIKAGCRLNAITEALTAAYGAGHREGVASVGDPVSKEAEDGAYDKSVQAEAHQENTG